MADLLYGGAQRLARAVEAAAAVPLHQVDVEVRLRASLEELIGPDTRVALGRLLGVLARLHLNEAKPFRASAELLGHDVGRDDRPGLGEELTKSIIRGVEAETADEEFLGHGVASCFRSFELPSPDRGRN